MHIKEISLITMSHRDVTQVIYITDKFQKNHCQRANKREQPIIDLMLSRRLNEQTIGKKEYNKR